MRQFITGSHQQIKSCGICSNIDHATDMCPTLHEEPCQQANATGVFPGPAQRKYDPYSNFYNPGWRDHPNLSYGNNQMNQYRPPFQPQPQPRPSVSQSSNPPIEDIVKMLATNTLQFQQETRSSIQNLEKQMSQLVTSMGKLEAQGSEKLPSQTIVNP